MALTSKESLAVFELEETYYNTIETAQENKVGSLVIAGDGDHPGFHCIFSDDGDEVVYYDLSGPWPYIGKCCTIQEFIETNGAKLNRTFIGTLIHNLSQLIY